MCAQLWEIQISHTHCICSNIWADVVVWNDHDTNCIFSFCCRKHLTAWGNYPILHKHFAYAVYCEGSYCYTMYTRKVKGHVGINNQGAILDYCVVTLETCDERDPLDMQGNVNWLPDFLHLLDSCTRQCHTLWKHIEINSGLMILLCDAIVQKTKSPFFGFRIWDRICQTREACGVLGGNAFVDRKEIQL